MFITQTHPKTESYDLGDLVCILDPEVGPGSKPKENPLFAFLDVPGTREDYLHYLEPQFESVSSLDDAGKLILDPDTGELPVEQTRKRRYSSDWFAKATQQVKEDSLDWEKKKALDSKLDYEFTLTLKEPVLTSGVDKPKGESL
jgi:hypothetical protein